MITSIEEINVTFCDNGFLVQFNYSDEADRYQTKRMIFATKQELCSYFDLLIEVRDKNANSSL